MVTLREYKKRKDFLICVDSDGCAMDTMDIKHIRCFGPCMVEEWELSTWENAILERWNEINLYTMTRGINRFKGLAIMLKEVDALYKKIEGIKTLEEWVEKSNELSNQALEKAVSENGSICLRKALSWSKKVNKKIAMLPQEEKRPFPGVRGALECAHEKADIAIVSSANLQAVEEEWSLYGLLEHVDILLAQNSGSKDFCMEQMLGKGYDREKTLMIGDAPGDLEAAEKNGICFFPILVSHETESWEEFRKKTVAEFENGNYRGEYEEKKRTDFWNNLQ